ESHVGSPAPSLVVLHPGAPQRHSQIVGRVFPTPLLDHSVPVPLAVGPGVQQVRSRYRAAGIAARGRGLASPSQPATPHVAGPRSPLRVGPAATATAADAPAGHTGHVAVLAPAPGGTQVAVPEPARPPVAEPPNS